MKIAVFSDIHANIYAFRAALTDAAEHGVTDYIFLGDLITDLPWVNEVYDIVRGLRNVRIIRGNRERAVLELDGANGFARCRQTAALYWTREKLSEENLRYLSALPDTLSFELNGTHFRLVHCPGDIWGKHVSDGLHYFAGRDDTHADYTRIMTAAVKNHPDVVKQRQGIYLYGHFHGQWHVRLGETLIANPGSCGGAGDNEIRAEYSILSHEDGRWQVDERLVAYNQKDTLREFRSSEIYRASPVWSEAVAMLLETGRETIHHLFAHLNGACAVRGLKPPYFPYPDDIWDDEGQKWVEAYRAHMVSQV